MYTSKARARIVFFTVSSRLPNWLTYGIFYLSIYNKSMHGALIDDAEDREGSKMDIIVPVISVLNQCYQHK